MLALANSVCLLSLSRSDRHVLVLLLCAGLIALCSAALAVDARQHVRTYQKKKHKHETKNVGEGSSSKPQKSGKRLARKD